MVCTDHRLVAISLVKSTVLGSSLLHSSAIAFLVGARGGGGGGGG